MIAGLSHASDDEPGLRRQRHGKHFRYVDPAGKPVRDQATLARIRALAIPPAWTHVWISPTANGHIQATGRDAKGRKQYRYHTTWRKVRDEAKYHRLVAFCRALPLLRDSVERDLSCTCLCKRKVIATVVALMERAQLRVGNDAYARENGSYGATTLRDRHAKIHGNTIELSYRGKSGVDRRVKLTDRRLARIVRACRDLPGQRLFQYIDGDSVHPITSSDVNAYIHEVSGGPFTAKDYRTWAATLGAALLVCAQELPANERAAKRSIKSVCECVAAKLGHTPTVCRSSYIHPKLFEDYAQKRLTSLSRALQRHVGVVELGVDAIDVTVLRKIEPVVARYLGTRAVRTA